MRRMLTMRRMMMARRIGVSRWPVSKCATSMRYQSSQSPSQSPSQYSEKLLQEAKRRGFNSVEELKDHLRDEIESKKRELNKIDPLRELEDWQSSRSSPKVTKFSPDRQAKTKVQDAPKETPPFKTLASYMKLDKVFGLSAEQVEFIWKGRWATKENTLCAVVPRRVFDQMMTVVWGNPAFVLPLPRTTPDDQPTSEKPAVELHYVQWNAADKHTVHCMITSLAEYKLHTQFARPHTVLEFHRELEDTHQVVLMNGTVESDCNVSLQDAHLLLLNVQRFYGALGTDTDIARKRLKLLQDFTQGSSEFDLDLLIELSQSLDT
ncbi:Atp11p KNAG_0K02510 [Huiozyma naganishii CBS 8797]|uniref:ATP11-domain-containing protein n=1 Tax=Huiozyma naganishii (strain ATCC MYA-139 / BCRC 22969 / CBS 8797 / KCTC 17520 / NBRC 10181 / NCYC 3082 / Yp74L-3) TaxID=1071383 RepID=J7SAB5_HUIN7|nr:hypothetical protein KNAG_0K02510 [Kazachstania naganishii CBS 8797]CCK72614.1 hypothetical protein KNAG_0K02510 [Kazachstania naganishii CBS 8797]